MKKYLLFITALAVLAGCKKHETVENSSINSTAKTYSMSTTLWAGQDIDVGTVSFYDPSDGNGGPLEVTYTLTGGWTMTESHVYAGSVDDMPVNNPGSPKVGKFPYQETHANVTTYTYYIPVTDTARFAIAAHCVVENNGNDETGWASGDRSFNDKGWGTFISNFYSISNYQFNELYGIVESNDGGLNIVLINGDNGTSQLIVNEYITGSGSASNAAYDPQTGYIFFIIGNNLYANDMNSEAPSYLLGPVASTNINGATFMNDSYYYYDGNLNQVMVVPMNYTSSSGLWSMGSVSAYSTELSSDFNFTVTDITSNDLGFYLVGFNNAGSIDVYDYGISNTSEFTYVVTTGIDPLVDSPTIAWNTIDNQLYGMDIGTGGNNILVTIDLTYGNTDGNQDGDTNPPEIPDDNVVLMPGGRF